MLAFQYHRLRKEVFLRFFSKIIEHDDVQNLLYKYLKRPIDVRSHVSPESSPFSPHPYPDIGASYSTQQTSQRSDPIFITARFRSGSTLLWNIFRQIEGVTSYYEPFNERQWFNKDLRGEHTDITHRNVSDYWREYDGVEILQSYYDIAWIDKNLLMDSSCWAPAMKRFVELLIEKAPGRAVLQFNRIDFRLPWFRHYFPHVNIIHLYRHPRDQWCSSLMGSTGLPHTAAMVDFAPHDHFYLRRWARDLQFHFPFLDESLIEHPYQMFYFIWKLSYLFGIQYAHCSLAYEDLVTDTETCLARLLSTVGIQHYDMRQLTGLIGKPSLAQWKHYADEDWFRHHESLCETTLAQFFGLKAKRDERTLQPHMR
jgi:hypothetical protein